MQSAQASDSVSCNRRLAFRMYDLPTGEHMTRSPLDPDEVRAALPGIPRWIKVSGLVVVALIVLLIAVMLLAGGDHGPGRHMSTGPNGELSATTPAALASMGGHS